MANVTLNEQEKIQEILERYEAFSKIIITAPNNEMQSILSTMCQQYAFVREKNAPYVILFDTALKLLENMYKFKGMMLIHWNSFIATNGMETIKAIGGVINV